jgi:hypothetical protein
LPLKDIEKREKRYLLMKKPDRTKKITGKITTNKPIIGLSIDMLNSHRAELFPNIVRLIHPIK